MSLRRLLSILLSIAMVFSTTPSPAYASASTDEGEVVQTTTSTETPTGDTSGNAESAGESKGTSASSAETELPPSGEQPSNDAEHVSSDLKDSVVARTTEDAIWEASKTARYQVSMGVDGAVAGDYVTATFDATATDIQFTDDQGYFSSIKPVSAAEAGQTTYKMVLSDKGVATETVGFDVSFKTVGADKDQTGFMRVAGEKFSYTVKAATSTGEDGKADSAAGTASKPGAAQRVQAANAGSDVSSHFHATISSSMDSYPSESVAVYSVKYALDQNSISEDDYIYVTVPKSVASSVDLSASSQHFKSTEKSSESPDDITYKLTFGPNAGSALSGGFSMFIHTNKVDKTTKGSIRVGSAAASITVNPSGSSSGGATGSETRAISKDANGKTDGSLAYGGWDTSDGRDRASIISIMTKVPTYVTYRVFVNPKKGNLKNVTVTDPFPDGMHLEEGSVTVKDWDTGEEITNGYTLDAESGSLRFESSEINGHEYCISYRLRFDDGENPSKGKYKNNATITYDENGGTYSESKGSIVQGADYSASNGEKSVDKSVISGDPSDQTVTYTIKFWNNNGFKAGEINLTDNLDKYVEYTGAATNDYFSVRQDPNDPQKILITNTKDINGDQTMYVRFTTDFSKVPVGYTVSNTVGGNTTKTTKVGGSVLLSAKKTVDGKAPTAGQKFDFELLDESGNVLQTVQNNGSDVAFNKIDYSKDDLGKTYTYKIREKDSGDGAYVRDSREYTVIVKVAGSVDQGGKILTTVTYKNAAGNAVDIPTFNNRETTSVKVTKVWDDNGNADGIRPGDGAIVQLYANGTAQGDPVKVQDSHTWKDLPVCDADGNQIAYTVDELNVAAGYDKDIKGDAKSGFTITNTEKRAEPETRYDSITVNKRDAETNEALAGATFGVYRDSACATEPVLQFVTDGNAKSLSTETDLKDYVPQAGQSAHLYLKEISAPEGYDPSSTVFDIKVSCSESHVFTTDGAYKSVTTHTVTIDGQSDLTVYNSKSAPKVKLGVAAIKVHKTLDGEIPSDGSFVFRLLQQNPGHFYNEAASGVVHEGGNATLYVFYFSNVEGTIGDHDYVLRENFSVNNTGLDIKPDTHSVFVRVHVEDAGSMLRTTVSYYADAQHTKPLGESVPTFNNKTRTKVEVTKVWSGDEGRDGVRPKSVTAKLYANGVEKGSVTLAEDGITPWKHVWSKLPTHDGDGAPITYTVRESDVPKGYASSVSSEAIKNSAGDQIGTSYTISNELRTNEKTEDGKLTIVKMSQLDELLGGARFGLYSDEACTDKVEDLTTDGGDDWTKRGTATVSTTDAALASLIPDAGQNRTLYLREDEAPAGYELSDANPVYGITLSTDVSTQYDAKTNAYVTTTSHKIKGPASSNSDGLLVIRNAHVSHGSIQLKAAKVLDGRAPESKTFTFELRSSDGKVLKTAQNNGGDVVFDKIEYGKADLGKTYTYTISEQNGGDSSISYDDARYTVEVKVAKKANPDGTIDTIATYKDGSGKSIATQAADGTVEGTLPTFRNRTITRIKVSKSWDDNDNADGIRPQGVKAQLYANGEKSGAPLTLNAGNGWAAEWDNLFAYDEHGNQIIYTVREEGVPAGYQATVTGDAANGFVLTNTESRREERIDNAITVTKTDADGNALDGATFGLYEDEGCTKEITTFTAGTATIGTSNEALAALLPVAGESRILYLREDQAPKGYAADSKVRQVVISASVSGEVKDGTYVRTTTYGIKVDGATEVKVPNAKVGVAAAVHATKAKPSRVVWAARSVLPQTGDGTSYFVPGVLFVAGIALVILGARKRRS